MYEYEVAIRCGCMGDVDKEALKHIHYWLKKTGRERQPLRCWQGFSGQGMTCQASPRHVCPVPRGAGDAHSLCLSRVVLPQPGVQVLHWLHDDHPPSTAKDSSNIHIQVWKETCGKSKSRCGLRYCSWAYRDSWVRIWRSAALTSSDPAIVIRSGRKHQSIKVN